MKNKLVITSLGALLFAVVIFSLLSQFASDVAAPATSGGAFSDSLWSEYAWATVVIALIIFAGGVGVLALVGGEFRWR
jgi:hypothetical protein